MSNRLYNQFSFSPERQPVSLMGKFIQSSVFSFAQLINQTLQYDAVTAGSAGNNITIRLVNPGVDGALSVAVVGTAITVTLARASGILTTTANDLVTAIQGSVPASALTNITVASGDGTNVLTALPTTHFTGGVDSIMSSNAMNMSMTNPANRTYIIQLEDEFPELLSAQVTMFGINTSHVVSAAETAFGTSKTITIGTGDPLSVGNGIFVSLILRNSSNP